MTASRSCTCGAIIRLEVENDRTVIGRARDSLLYCCHAAAAAAAAACSFRHYETNQFPVECSASLPRRVRTCKRKGNEYRRSSAWCAEIARRKRKPMNRWTDRQTDVYERMNERRRDRDETICEYIRLIRTTRENFLAGYSDYERYDICMNFIFRLTTFRLYARRGVYNARTPARAELTRGWKEPRRQR